MNAIGDRRRSAGSDDASCRVARRSLRTADADEARAVSGRTFAATRRATRSVALITAVRSQASMRATSQAIAASKRERGLPLAVPHVQAQARTARAGAPRRRQGVSRGTNGGTLPLVLPRTPPGNGPLMFGRSRSIVGP